MIDITLIRYINKTEPRPKREKQINKINVTTTTATKKRHTDRLKGIPNKRLNKKENKHTKPDSERLGQGESEGGKEK